METNEPKRKKDPTPKAQLERRLENELWYVDTERSDGWRWREGVEEEPQWVMDMRRRFEARGVKL